MAVTNVQTVLGTAALPHTVEHFSVQSQVLRKAERIDASYFNPAAAHALEILRHSGMRLATVGELTQRVFIPNRFARIYVGHNYGLPFLQGSHIVHFQPADVKHVSIQEHKHIDRWVIRKDWILVTRSGTVGRVALCPSEWDGWAASEHILRIIPNTKECPSGYLYSFLASPLGQVQLTRPIYGAVVDELTEAHTSSVLVPMPVNAKQKAEMARINEEAHKAVATRSLAVSLINAAVTDLTTLVDPDHIDAAIAEQRLGELEANPDLLIAGAELKEKLDELLA
jgi:hypothetical protein